MGSGGVAIAALPTVICLKVPFSDGLGGGDNSSHLQYTFYALRILNNSVRIFIGKRDSKNIKSKWQQTE